ncbi:MAG: type II secretion system protein [Patescibacteria group bacterium]
MRTHNHGFTLIELLVVISIIGLLSSIVISSLTVARQKGKDGAVKQQVNQLRNLIELNYSEYGTYTQIQPYVWFQNPTDCLNAITTGNYAIQAQLICLNLFKLNGNSPNNFLGPNYFLFLGNGVSNSTKYSISTYLPGKGTFYCAGSSGRSSDNTTNSDTWANPGCSNNP